MDLLPYAVSGAISLVVGWITRQQSKAETATAEMQKKCQAIEVALAELKAKTDGNDAAAKQLQEELSDIRNNMVRQKDLDALGASLGQRIEDAIRYVKGS